MGEFKQSKWPLMEKYISYSKLNPTTPQDMKPKIFEYERVQRQQN
jgi:hypothetical protein